jgi:amino acid adenylation domain-containing protein
MRHESIVELFEKAVDRFGSNVAISVGDREVSYEEVEKKANRLANFLLDAGIGKESPVVMMVDDKIEAISSIIGILKAGCAYVPLETGMPDRRLKEMISQVRAEWYVIEAKHAEKLSVVADVERANIVCIDEGESNKVRALEAYRGYVQKSRPGLRRGEDELCYVYFTSGSTGIPKGIAGRLKGIDHFIRWEVEMLGIGESDRVSQLLPMTFDGSLRDIFAALIAGGRVCAPRDRETILGGGTLMEWIEKEGISVMHCVPSLLRMMVNEKLKEEYFQRLRYILLTGEPLLPADVQKWVNVYGSRVQLVNLYGTSETTMAKFYYFIKEGDGNKRAIPIGKPMPGAKALLLKKNLTPCPPGVVGEIYIKTPYRSLGYYGQPKLTSDVFIQDPLSPTPGEIVYRTGDLARLLEDENYEYVGRRDQQVKIRGMRVELSEVENALREQPEVKDVAVVDQEDGGGYKYLCAYLVLKEGGNLAEVRKRLSQELPEYLMPSAMAPISEMPRTISGKIDRKALVRIVEEEKRAGKKRVLPRTPVEEMIAGIWAELLKVEEVSVEDNFFQVGGHSLMAIQMLTRARNAFLVDLPLQTLFEFPTVAGLAEQIEIARGAKSPVQTRPLVRVSRDRGLPLSFAQQALWIFDQLEPNSYLYNIHSSIRLSGALDVRALNRSLNEILRRHESLRTKFQTVDDQPVQIFSPWRPMRLSMVDLTVLPERDREREAKKLARAEAHRPFNLEKGPLLRISLLRLGEQAHAVLFTIHHIIGDGWSMGILIREVATLYTAYSAGSDVTLPELPIQYADFAVWQREWLSGEALAHHMNYWRKQLSGALPKIKLPMDRPHPPVQTYRGKSQPLGMTRQLLNSLRSLSREESVTLFMTVLAAFKVLLHRYTGEDDIMISTPIANRTRVEIEGLIGCFVNMIVLRSNLSGNPTFRDFLRHVREVALDAYDHQDLPFELLVEEFRPERKGNQTPFFQVCCESQNVPTQPHESPGLMFNNLGIDRKTSHFDLMLSITEYGDTIDASLEYKVDLFDDDTISEMIKRFRVLLKNIIQNPDLRLLDIPISVEEENPLSVTELVSGGRRFIEDQFAFD